MDKPIKCSIQLAGSACLEYMFYLGTKSNSINLNNARNKRKLNIETEFVKIQF